MKNKVAQRAALPWPGQTTAVPTWCNKGSSCQALCQAHVPTLAKWSADCQAQCQQQRNHHLPPLRQWQSRMMLQKWGEISRLRVECNLNGMECTWMEWNETLNEWNKTGPTACFVTYTSYRNRLCIQKLSYTLDLNRLVDGQATPNLPISHGTYKVTSNTQKRGTKIKGAGTPASTCNVSRGTGQKWSTLCSWC